ncbi:MAG TPA: hypothetical protein VLB76_23815 [Thermoanaerobaculia bacterium]|jgi:hypothetical protein|nr:hypothetical protein [Thermoanaerobaculia bacterium]
MALGTSFGRVCVLLVLGAALGVPAVAQETGETAANPGWTFQYNLEVRANYRDSEENRFPLPYAFELDQLPVGQTRGFEETVDAGSHFEFSNVALFATVGRGDLFTAHGKLDLIDLYDRNPTSTGQKVDIDEAWLRFGREPETATLAARSGVYLKLGKIPKFERQDDRHLQSYGLVSTAFNRFEETGAELGLHLGRHFYLKARAAAGNPVFLRDPNALAGDNGTPELRRLNPDPDLKSGVPILYNAHSTNFDLDGELETGAGVGWRLADEGGRNGLDLLAWENRRKLADTVRIHGTFYGGDLDILSAPPTRVGNATFAIRNDEKREVGGNVWLYLGGFSFFGQYVDQDLAGLPRTGVEGEVAWRFDLPLLWAVGGRQLFPSIAPSVRYSKLDNDFRNPPQTPSPSFSWDWEKIDAGLRLGLLTGLDLTLEYADNRFILATGAKRKNNEFLTTLAWRLR